jgi:homoserine dehydrogenase
MSAPLRIALAGLGTVGTGVIRLIEENNALIARRAGRKIEIAAVTARDRSKDRGVDLSGYRWVDDMGELATAGDVDVVVELVGGSDGPALTLARETLSNGRALVTANKAMIAHHGAELAALAEGRNAALKFEAAVAGGIPVIQGLRDGAAANRIDRVYGILNGTCNFILSTMEREGLDFAEVLADAQARGFAEADPSFDIDGVDAAHKLSILASLSFGSEIDFGGVEARGIRKILAADIAQAKVLGYRIRLIGLAEIDGENGSATIFQRVQPCLVPLLHPLASAVVADLVDIARKEVGPAFSMPSAELEKLPRAASAHRIGKTYLRMVVADRVGVLAEITAAMRDAGLSIESLIQTETSDDGSALIAMVTHEGPEQAINDTLKTLSNSNSLLGEPMVMHILGE